MDYNKGERIKHPQKEDWGLGELLRDSHDEKIWVFFTEVGEKILSLKYMTPKRIDADKAQSSVLDNLVTTAQSERPKYKNMSMLIADFIKIYPGGFRDSEYIKKERDKKVTAHHNAVELLDEEDLNTLLQKSEYDAVCQRALQIIKGTTLIFPREKATLEAALTSTTQQKLFAEGIYQLLYGVSELRIRFRDFSTVLKKIGTPKWTILSYLLFVVFPEKYMFLKPRVTKKAAEISAFEINYASELSWLTYKSVLKYAQYLTTKLSKLNPRDMFDIQSFMWSIA
jgi:hypothetical protein